MKSHGGLVTMLIPITLSLVPACFGATLPVSCDSIYTSFAQCLLTFDQNLQDSEEICRSWNAFHVCADSALVGCPADVAAIWESLKQKDRKTQYSRNLYDMCANRTTLPPSTVPAPQSPPTSYQSNQEALKGQADRHGLTLAALLLPACCALLLPFNG
ncbi:neuritin 1-like b [Brachionichthys hirsutus]|uniref:neuritin 1-like b n=1 Tax=Brachionichthys hirsutus TaxID=412623 RepID=UPI0036054180